MESCESLFVDVDGTLLFWDEKPGRVTRGVPLEQLHLHCIVNVTLVERLKRWKKPGNLLVVWSMGGKDHAQWAVKLVGLQGAVDVCLPKPCGLVDDAGDRWNRHLQFFGPSGDK